MQKPDASGRMIKWAVELSEFIINFAPRTSIKGQALADFIAENSRGEELETPAALEEYLANDDTRGWMLSTDGSSTYEGTGAGFVLTPLEGKPLKYAMVLPFRATSNEDEYEALVTGLMITKGVGIEGE